MPRRLPALTPNFAVRRSSPFVLSPHVLYERLVIGDKVLVKWKRSTGDTTELMKEAAKNLDFLQAAQYRDEIVRLQDELEGKE